MSELILLCRSSDRPQNGLDVPYLKSCGFSGSKVHTATGPGIASIFAVIHESNHAHFLRSVKVNALAQNAAMNMQFEGAAVSCIHSY